MRTPRKSLIRWIFELAPILLVALLIGASADRAAASAAEPPAEAPEASPRPRVVHVRVDSIIHPVVAGFLADALDEADRLGAQAIVIELSTPGGLLTSTREISTAMLGAETPVVVYVSPSGAQAASAGFFLLMAADVAAMAPETNTGAAHPVGGQGEDIEGTMAEKVEQDAAATIRTLAERNGRDLELAEAAVVQSRSYTAREALESGLVDLIAPDVRSLLDAIDGREVRASSEQPVVLATRDAEITEIEMSKVQRLLSAIAHPNIAYILMTLGGLGLYFELSNPGAVLPGVIGGISLILAFFALSVLPVNYAGIALIVLAMIFFIAEIKVTSYGLLTVAGVGSLVLGSLMLFKSADPAIRVSLDVIFFVVAATVVVVVSLVLMVVRVHRSQVRTGVEGLIHEVGSAQSALEPRGKVFVHGELWDAVADESVVAGDRVEVVEVKGMTLRVRKERNADSIEEGSI
jgi:membrane-bound serine protease (ClpP class)